MGDVLVAIWAGIVHATDIADIEGSRGVNELRERSADMRGGG